MSIRRVILPEGKRLVFYLAAEEYVAAHRELGEAIFFWKVPPTVIFGRNQVMSSEVNVEWCSENGVQMCRRKSGGGCVYSDLGNLMISYVSSGTEVGRVFGGYLEVLAGALRSLGVNAQVSGRNDVLIDGRKVSGNAFQLLGDRSIVHGTLLYDTDFAALEKAITPSRSKIQSKGVSSVRQRVTNLKPCLEAAWQDGNPNVNFIMDHVGDESGSLSICPVRDIDSLADYLAKQLCESVVALDEAAIAEISEIEKSYLDPGFIAGHENMSTSEVQHRSGMISGVGHVSLELTLTGGKISRVHLGGDYFALKTPDEIDAALSAALSGSPLSRDEIHRALSAIDLSELIPDLTASSLTEILTKDNGVREQSQTMVSENRVIIKVLPEI